MAATELIKLPSPQPPAMPDAQQPLPFERLFSIKGASEETGIKYWLLMRAVNNGDIPFYRFGNKRRRVRLSDITAAIQSHRADNRGME